MARVGRSAEQLKAQGFGDEMLPPGLPLRKIIDTVHFAEKADARPLQLADLCAFILGRGLKGNPVPEYATRIVMRHLNWITRDRQALAGPTFDDSEGAAREQPS
jgi:hypothetical protein